MSTISASRLRTTKPPSSSTSTPTVNSRPTTTSTVSIDGSIAPEATATLPVTAESISLLQLKLEDTCRKVYSLSRELEQTKGEYRQQQAELNTRVTYLQSELVRKEQINKTLAKQIQELTLKQGDDLTTNKTFMEQTLKQAHDLFLQKEDVLLKKQHEIMAELADLRVFSQIREDLTQELSTTKQALVDTERKHRLQLEQLEQRFIAARDKLEKEASEMLSKSKAVYKSEVGKELDVEGRLIRTQNIRLANQMRLHEQTSVQYGKQNEKLTSELSQLKIDYSLLQERSEQMVKNHVKLRKHSEELLQKVRVLESNLSQTLQTSDSERQNWLVKKDEEKGGLSKEIDQLKLMLMKKDNEVRAIRKQANVLLQNRKDIETFFAEALDKVKHDLIVKNELEYRQAVHRHQQYLKSLTKGLTSVAPSRTDLLPPLAPSKRITLKDLGEEDRYQIIRLLYARLKGVSTSNNVRLPPHSFANDIDDDVDVDGDGDGHGEYDPDNAPPLALSLQWHAQDSSGSDVRNQSAVSEEIYTGNEGELTFSQMIKPESKQKSQGQGRIEPSFFMTDVGMVEDEDEVDDAPFERF